MPGGCASGESGAEEIPSSDLACGDLACGEVAGFSGNIGESPACSSTSDNKSTLDGDSAIPAPTPEGKVWKKVNVNSEQAEHIEKITRAQAGFC